MNQEQTASQFNSDYYLKGKDKKVSNYTDYSWRPDLTIPACDHIIRYLGIQKGETLLDFGCARGYMVNGFRMLGVEAFGFDISKWAIENCHEDVKEFVSNDLNGKSYHWVISKDVLEHVPYPHLGEVIRKLCARALCSVLICVPVAQSTEGPYVLDGDNADVTHVIRWTLEDWLEFIQQTVDDAGVQFLVSASHRLPGLKEYKLGRHNGCAFFTLRRFRI